MPRTGAPSGTGSPGTMAALAVTATVASDGPYMLCIRYFVAQASTSSSEHASPPTITVLRAGKSPAGTVASAAGVMNAWVMRSERRNTASSAPPYRSAGATTIVAPAANPSSSSSTEASKLGEEKCIVRAWSVTLNSWVCSLASEAMPAWVTTTALGVPVEPEV